jgi:outer membrane protein assembly factor BamB
LKGNDFVNVALQDGDLYATAKGELFCLDPSTGNIRWQNPLKGLGWGFSTIAASSSQQAVVKVRRSSATRRRLLETVVRHRIVHQVSGLRSVILAWG